MADSFGMAGQAAAPASVEGQPQGTTTPEAASPAPSPSTPATPETEPKFEIKVGGKTEILTRDEIVARAQMGSDYTRKTQQLAEQQRQWQADREAILKQEREKWQRALESAQPLEFGSVQAGSMKTAPLSRSDTLVNLPDID